MSANDTWDRMHSYVMRVSGFCTDNPAMAGMMRISNPQAISDINQLRALYRFNHLRDLRKQWAVRKTVRKSRSASIKRIEKGFPRYSQGDAS